MSSPQSFFSSEKWYQGLTHFMIESSKMAKFYFQKLTKITKHLVINDKMLARLCSYEYFPGDNAVEKLEVLLVDNDNPNSYTIFWFFLILCIDFFNTLKNNGNLYSKFK